jgi:hypothetical protein
VGGKNGLVVRLVGFLLEKWRSNTHEEDETSIMIPVAIILFLKEGWKDSSVFGFTVQLVGVEIGRCSPADFVPVRYHIRGDVKRSRRASSWCGLGNIVGMSFDVVDGYRRNDIWISGVYREF